MKHKQNKKKPNKFFYIVLVLIPILFFVLLELSLRLFNYGYDNSTWIKITPTHYGLNPDVAKRYFHSVKNVPESIQDVFAIKKDPNAYRVFVLGGSSAAGYPFMPLGSFSRYIRQRLEENYPNRIIEVVNLSLTAVNSYTIRDLIPDVLEQSPDLILIYAGHNEYYGALGVGSMESLGRSRGIVNFVLSLNSYKTTLLVRDFLKYIITLLPTDKSKQKGTLMARMAQNQRIDLGSEVYHLGIEQFTGNMKDVIKIAKEKNVPLVISTVASNLKDQRPFISDTKEDVKNADLYYNLANAAYNKGNFKSADSLYRLAKDLDQLRFRAPEEINDLIKNLASQNNLPLLDADFELSKLSPNGIIGNNLMTDHLHLTLQGYQDLGKLFYDKLNNVGLLPAGDPVYDFTIQDSVTRANYYFSELDSTIADFKLKMLKNDWPFTIFHKSKNLNTIIKLNNGVDSLAYNFAIGKEEWEKSHRLLAATYMQRGEFDKGKNEIDILIHQYPLIVEYNSFLAKELINRKRYDEALVYLSRGYKLKKDHYFSKWLGIINLHFEKVNLAISFLEESLKYEPNDSQVLFNLSGAYTKKGNFKKSLTLIEKCLSINPNYQAAKNLYEQLKQFNKN